VVTFDNLTNPPALTGFNNIAVANGGTAILAGVAFDSSFYVCGDQYVEAYNNTGGLNVFLHPHPGHYALFNANGSDQRTLTTAKGLIQRNQIVSEDLLALSQRILRSRHRTLGDQHG